jgi:hypothetical protein
VFRLLRLQLLVRPAVSDFRFVMHFQISSCVIPGMHQADYPAAELHGYREGRDTLLRKSIASPGTRGYAGTRG